MNRIETTGSSGKTTLQHHNLLLILGKYNKKLLNTTKDYKKVLLHIQKRHDNYKTLQFYRFFKDGIEEITLSKNYQSKFTVIYFCMWFCALC